jgi:hypothetical protein
VPQAMQRASSTTAWPSTTRMAFTGQARRQR